MLSAMQPDHVGQAAPPGQLHVTRLQVGQNQKDNADSVSPKRCTSRSPRGSEYESLPIRVDL